MDTGGWGAIIQGFSVVKFSKFRAWSLTRSVKLENLAIESWEIFVFFN